MSMLVIGFGALCLVICLAAWVAQVVFFPRPITEADWGVEPDYRRAEQRLRDGGAL